MGLLIALGAMGVYALSNPEHYNQYNHFVWQADAFLHGRAWIPFPEAAISLARVRLCRWESAASIYAAANAARAEATSSNIGMNWFMPAVTSAVFTAGWAETSTSLPPRPF